MLKLNQIIGEQLQCVPVLALIHRFYVSHRTLLPLSSHDLDTVKKSRQAFRPGPAEALKPL